MKNTYSFPKRNLTPLSEKAVNSVLSELAILFNKILKKNSKIVVSTHEAYGFVAEEVKELLDAVHQNNNTEVYEELIDVAIAALWSAMSMRMVT